MNQSTKAILALFSVTIMWGLTFPLIKDAMQVIHPSAFVTLRLALAALVMLPFVVSRLHKTTLSLLTASLILGGLNAGIYITQSIGLETTSSANSAFITAMNVIIVPFLSPLFRVGRFGVMDISAALLTLLGIFVLTGASLSHITAGDYITLICAACYAVSIVVIQRVTKNKIDILLLVFYQILLGIPFSLGWGHFTNSSYVLNPTVWVALVFCAVFATCVTFYFQMSFQRYTTASKAALIYALEPVFATLFAFIINGEAITYYTILGGLLVLSGFAFSELWPRLRSNQVLEGM